MPWRSARHCTCVAELHQQKIWYPKCDTNVSFLLCPLWVFSKLGMQAQMWSIYRILESLHVWADEQWKVAMGTQTQVAVIVLFVCHKSPNLPMIAISCVLNGCEQCPARLLCGLPVTGTKERGQAKDKWAERGKEAPQQKGTGDNRTESGPGWLR